MGLTSGTHQSHVPYVEALGCKFKMKNCAARKNGWQMSVLRRRLASKSLLLIYIILLHSSIAIPSEPCLCMGCHQLMLQKKMAA